MSSHDQTERWFSLQQSVAERLDIQMREALAVAAETAWGAQRGSTWEVQAELAMATWHLYHLLGQDEEQRYRFHVLSVTPTIDPAGEVVALQVSNGQDFLALTDVSGRGLVRGLQYLILHKPLPEATADEPPFTPRALGQRRPARSWLQRLLGRS